MRSWDDVNEALKEIGGLNAEAAQIKERAGAALEKLKKRRGQLEERMEGFVRAREDELELRSKVLPCGRVWLREATHLTARSFEKVLQWLHEHGRREFIRVKSEIDKEALAKADPELLMQCGAKLKTEDKFGYEVG